MFAHVSVGATDIRRSIELYDQLMSALGYSQLFGDPKEEFMAYGDKDSFFIINTPLNPERGAPKGCNGAHVCLKAPSKDAVDAFYRVAREHNCESGGEPGVREEYAKDYYAAFVYDFDGNKIEVLARV